jgi:hypothetical protein
MFAGIPLGLRTPSWTIRRRLANTRNPGVQAGASHSLDSNERRCLRLGGMGNRFRGPPRRGNDARPRQLLGRANP